MSSKWIPPKAFDFKAFLYFTLVLAGGMICFNIKNFLKDNAGNTLIHSAVETYTKSMFHISKWFSVHVFNKATPLTDSPLFGPDFPVNLTAFSIQLLIITGLVLLIIPNPIKTKVVFGFFCLFTGLFFGILRMTIMLTWDIRQYPFWHQTLSGFSRFIIYFSVILAILYFLKKNKVIFNLLKEKLYIPDNEKLFVMKVVSIFILYFLLILLIFHPKLNIDDNFASFIMSSSHFLLNIFNYESEFIYPRILRFEHGGIFMGNPCLGINLMLIYITAIVLIGRMLKISFLFIIYGVLGIICLNILRISALFIFLFHNVGKRSMFLNSHDLFNWVVYGFIFLMLYFWIQKQKKLNPPPQTIS